MLSYVMRNDIYGQQILDELDLCSLYLSNPDIEIKNVLVSKEIAFDPILDIKNQPNLIQYLEEGISKQEFDTRSQHNWYMPIEYKNFDIASYVLSLCKTEEELQRVGKELLMFQDRELFPLLCYCKYLVDTMRKHNVVWGVGRGSSVSSYVLFLIEIHRINSLYWDLPIEEFLK